MELAALNMMAFRAPLKIQQTVLALVVNRLLPKSDLTEMASCFQEFNEGGSGVGNGGGTQLHPLGPTPPPTPKVHTQT